ncbi:hypothetical protein D3P07_11485 [Paenibacillus sp. 1011MAR3C5]|uniref:hypothetical protein n=1 Tax=Paenibacillus sp. 1011MAR3C5 TaxID=1675787 RepID=UPI000E6CECD8|nr:hypothetical protein [Paenibacillus sp. 1011MAR3C5]RJE88610.1 hypothetical protein D3P07_11485 [Paenibacillus sp. 1011MAR3C5]
MTTPKGFNHISQDVYFNPSTNEIVIVGELDDEDETHNCDHMGCSSVNHVVFRGKLATWRYSPPTKKREPYFYKGVSV